MGIHDGLFKRALGTPRGAAGLLAAVLLAHVDAWDARRDVDNRTKSQWLNESIIAYVRIAQPWTSADGIAIATATDLVQAYQVEVTLTALVFEIWRQNTLTADQRKNSQSPSDLQRSLVARTEARTGDAQEQTAAPVARSDAAA